MATDKNLQNLIINKLTKEQYDAIDSPSPDELYLVPDEIDDTPTQGSNNPVKSGGVFTALSGKQNTIDAQHKLDYSLIANTPTIPTEVFAVTYGTTTQSEILAAVAAGQLPVCKYGNNLYVYAGESSADYSQFTSVLYDTAYRIYVKNSTWGSGSYEVYSKPNGGIPASDLAAGVIPTDIVKYTAQTLTAAQKAQARTNIGATAPEIFWAEYGVTSFDDVKSAHDAGKVVMVICVYEETPIILHLGYVDEVSGFGVANFYGITSPAVLYGVNMVKYNGSSAWNELSVNNAEITEHKVSSWQNTPDNNHYPSEKLVKDSLNGKQPTIDASHKLDYSLLSNTPNIPAAQVPSDWNATEGVSRILNKPTVPATYAGSPTAGGFANKAVAIPFGSVDADSTATDIKATVDNFPTELTDGVCAYIRNDVIASASGWTLNINGTGAKPVYQTLSDESRVTTVFSAAVTYLFIYNSSRVEGGCWDIYYGYNANDNTIGYNLRTNTMSLPTTSACYRYRLLFTSADRTHFVPANASSSTSATAKKTATQTPIDPLGSIRYYSYTTAVSSGNRPGATYLWEQYLVTLGYSFNNTGAALTLTPWEPVYIMCKPQPDGSAIIVQGSPYVQSLPTTKDGYIYIYLGVATSATQVEVVFHHPVYYHDGICIKLWTGPTCQLQHHSDTDNGVTREYFLWADVQKATACNEFDIVDDKYGIFTYAHLTIVLFMGTSPIYSFVSIDEGGLTLLPFSVELDSQTSEPVSLTYGNTLYTYDSATQSFVYEHASS